MICREMRSGKREREKEKVCKVRAKEKERCKEKQEQKHGEASPRPKRLAVQKGLEYNHGLLWKEETDLKKALYMSLQESKKINMGVSQEVGVTTVHGKNRLSSTKKKLKNSLKTDDENHEIALKKTKVHAQRKFAQGSHPNSPVTTPVKFKSTTTNLIPTIRPKTEDFLTFLCLRGTSALPPSLDFFNFASRSNVQAVSDSRCQTPVTPDLSNQSSPFTRDHSNRASPLSWEQSNGTLSSLSEKAVKKTSDSKHDEKDLHEKKDMLNSKDNLENKKRDRSDFSKNQELSKTEKENYEGLKRHGCREKIDYKKKSECKGTVDHKVNLDHKSFNQENAKSPKKKKFVHRETRSERHHQENKESPIKKNKEIKKYLNHDIHTRDDNKKELKEINKKVENKDKELLKKLDNKEKRSSLKYSLKKCHSKDIIYKKSEKELIKNREIKYSVKKIDYKESLKKMEHLKSKTRAGQKRERKELLEKQEKLKKKKEDKVKDKKETQDKTKDKKESGEKLKEKELQEKSKEIKTEKPKDKRDNLEKSKEKKDMLEKLKERKEIQEKLKERKEAQEKIKEKKDALEKIKEKKDSHEKQKEKKDAQEKGKEKKDLLEKLKDKRELEKLKEKKENYDKMKKDLDKKEGVEKGKNTTLIERREILERLKSVPINEKKDSSDKSKGIFQIEKKDVERKNILAEKKDQLKIVNQEVLEKTRSATQTEKKEQEKVKQALLAHEKKELDRSKNLTGEKKEPQEKNKALYHMDKKEMMDKNKSVPQGDGFIFKRDEMRDRSMDPIVVVKARDTVGHRMEGGSKSQLSGVVAPVAIHVTSHRESARILEQSLPYSSKTSLPLISLLPVPPPIATVSKLKIVPSGTNNLLIKKSAKLALKKPVFASSPTGGKLVEEIASEKKDIKGDSKQRIMRKRKLSESTEEKPSKKKTPNKIMPISTSLTLTPSTSSVIPVPITLKDFPSLPNLKSREPLTPIKTSLKPPRHSRASSLATSPLRMPLPGSPDVSPPSKRRGRPPGSGKKQKLDPSLIPLEPFPNLDASAKMVDAPIYRPSEEEFNDPLIYIEKIREEAEKYGICCIIPPSSWKPDCKVSDDMRINSSIQYVHKMLYRWGPNVQHVECVRKHLETQGVTLGQAPLIGGVELDVSRLYQTIHHFGGMQQVNDKKKWNKVADALHIPKVAHDRVSKLYDAYCKYLVSYDTLSKEDQQKLDQQVTAERQKKRYRASGPNLNCIVRGRLLSLSGFCRVARNTLSTWFKQDPTHQEAEHEFWRVVTERLIHTAVHSGNLDTKVCGSGFPSNKASPFSKHGWNLNVLAHNSANILRFLSALHIAGITSPVLHVGMLYTASCWYRDPHFLPKIEYLHTGADKIWYCIPESHGEVFHQAMKTAVPEYCVKTPIWLPSETIMVPPFMLVANGVSLCRLVQQAGQFVVVFSQAYTASICCGYNISESIIFSKSDWLNKCPQAFKNLKESCEPPLFSLERLLFAFVHDHRTQIDILQKIFPMLEEIRDVEVKLRKQLFDIGLKTSEKIGTTDETKNKSRKQKNYDEDGECEVCRCFCYLSMVINELEESVYCLQHAINLLQKRKNFKNWKLLYRLDQTEINDILMMISLRLASAAASPKKKTAPKSPKM